LGATGYMLDCCVLYGSINLIVLPAFILQLEFHSFFITAEKPQLGLIITVAAGVSNIILDAILVWPLGLLGTSIATAASQLIGGLVPLFYFARKNNSLLKLGKTSFDGKALLKTCTNGSSELMSQLSMSLVGMLYNIQLLKYAGENGVAAYGVLMYVNFIFISLFIGYSIGTAPVIGYHYGAENRDELKSLLRKSLILIGSFSLALLGISFLLAAPLSRLFVGYDELLCAMTTRGFFIFSFSFLFAGTAIFSSGFFTALNDGVTSAIISFLRTLVFQTAAVMLLPLWLGLDGIWLSIVVAEVVAVIVDICFLLGKKKRFGY
ncbi:MAG: MATE family efflux transporter, partial [Clostridia bacterium]|nr:MATE family efflux transporter [Clostridia bacterium]